ncbi:hypothetical protein Nepgr_016180 [Nepenthes gracilis]|uniref:Uncharacterized protein n=1 Tax=Nepenthes gracilis TaxID=150966 RepID=A0AAD3XRT8_NEPGR|nr:hypothetical protein Nepgr_016180 [Nepenthes gracilis]
MGLSLLLVAELLGLMGLSLLLVAELLGLMGLSLLFVSAAIGPGARRPCNDLNLYKTTIGDLVFAPIIAMEELLVTSEHTTLPQTFCHGFLAFAESAY